jgi:hypothetical protein
MLAKLSPPTAQDDSEQKQEDDADDVANGFS